MSRVRIEPSGLYAYDWNSDTRSEDRTPADPDAILTYLRRACTIADGVTLRDIFRMVESHPTLKAFVAQYSWCGEIDEFHAQAEEPMRSERSPNDVEYLEISHVVEASTHMIKGEERTDLSAYTDFHGIGHVHDIDHYREHIGGEPPEDGVIAYGVSYSPMYDLADLPVKLNERVDLYHSTIRSRKRGGPSRDKLVSGTMHFTLLQVLDTIYDDISFMGGPDDNREFVDGMKEKLARYDAGEIEALPWDVDAMIAEAEEGDDDGEKRHGDRR